MQENAGGEVRGGGCADRNGEGDVVWRGGTKVPAYMPHRVCQEVTRVTSPSHEVCQEVTRVPSPSHEVCQEVTRVTSPSHKLTQPLIG